MLSAWWYTNQSYFGKLPPSYFAAQRASSIGGTVPLHVDSIREQGVPIKEMKVTADPMIRAPLGIMSGAMALLQTSRTTTYGEPTLGATNAGIQSTMVARMSQLQMLGLPHQLKLDFPPKFSGQQYLAVRAWLMETWINLVTTENDMDFRYSNKLEQPFLTCQDFLLMTLAPNPHFWTFFIRMDWHSKRVATINLEEWNIHDNIQFRVCLQFLIDSFYQGALLLQHHYQYYLGSVSLQEH